MFTNLSKIPIKLGILLIGVGLLVAGCDSAGTNNKQDQNAEEKIAFETADWSDDRITRFNESNSSNAKAATQKSVPGFNLDAQLGPPTQSINNAAASHLAVSELSGGDKMLYVGYKTAGDSYGGGIDILKDDGTLDDPGGDSDNLEEAAVDVQELAVKESSGPNVLYVATAVNPDVTIPQSPQFHSINLNTGDGLPAGSSVEYDVFDLGTEVGEAAVAKSLTLLKNPNTADVLVASDRSTAYQVETTTNNSTNSDQDYEIDDTDRAQNSNINQIRNVTETRSTTTGSKGAYALTYDGGIWKWESSSPSWSETTSSSGLINGSLSNPGTSPSPIGDSDSGIARLSSYVFNSSPHSNDALVFAALNDDGFQVYNPTTGGGEVRFDSRTLATNSDEVPEIYATSVTATEDFVYVASGTTIAVYKVETTGLGGPSNKDEGLEYVGQQSFEKQLSPNGGQINDIYVDENPSSGDAVLYVSKGTDGVLKITQNDDALY